MLFPPRFLIMEGYDAEIGVVRRGISGEMVEEVEREGLSWSRILANGWWKGG